MRKIHWHKEPEAPSLIGGLREATPSAQWLSDLPMRADTQSVEGPAHLFVVIIDDSLTVRKIIETCLGREGYTVKGFADGQEALCWFTGPTSRTPDLVLLDIGLPKMDGYEVARRLNAIPRFHQTVLLILSRHDSVIDRLKGRLVGAREYITKPFKTNEVIAVIQRSLCSQRQGMEVHV